MPYTTITEQGDSLLGLAADKGELTALHIDMAGERVACPVLLLA